MTDIRETIPDDVMRAAREVAERVQKDWNEYHTPTVKEVLLVANAILAERERCAVICEHFAQQWDNGRDDGRPNDGFNACMEAVAAIRQSKEPGE